MTLSKEEFVSIEKLFDKADTEQLQLIVRWVENIVLARVNEAAIEAGLVKEKELEE